MRVLYFYLICLLSTSFWAQTKVSGPHGGNLVTAKEYKLEMTACSEYFEIYLYDSMMQPVINAGITGVITYNIKDKPAESAELQHWGIDGYSVKGKDDFINCRITLLIHGRPIVAVFDNKFTCEQ